MLGILFLGSVGYAVAKLLGSTDHVEIDTTNERVVSIQGSDLEVHNRGPKSGAIFPVVRSASVSRKTGKVWFDGGDRKSRFWTVSIGGSSDDDTDSSSDSDSGFLDTLSTSVARGLGYKEEDHTSWW